MSLTHSFLFVFKEKESNMELNLTVNYPVSKKFTFQTKLLRLNLDEEKAKDLAGRFNKNFAKYEGNPAGKALVSAGPQL